ncbi:hypothetical protein [Streptomyces sp. NPDC048282]|uniref:hypothetical protein n=1 Tax=Streptomyces sp. NPDC048282 TaxID=3365528 RepID=UPI0037182FE0
MAARTTPARPERDTDEPVPAARAAHTEPRPRDSYPFPSHGAPHFPRAAPGETCGADRTELGGPATAEEAVALVVRHPPPEPGQP